jgi:hypothetical protein
MRQRLIENFSLHSKSIKEIPLKEKLIESNGMELIAKRKFRCPVSRYDYENLNGRIYSKKLWEKVIKEQKDIWEGCPCLADHPTGDDSGSVRNIVGIWNNLHFGESKDNLLYADITFVGDLGQKAIDVMEAGGRVGFSSSGFGDLKEDSKYIDEATYQIERISDWVLTPSQEVYGYIDDELKETIKEEINILDKTSTNIVEENIITEKSKEKHMLNEIEKKNFKMGVNNLKKSALAESDLSKKLTLFKEIVEYTQDVEEGKDIFTEATKEIEIIEGKIAELAKKGEKLDEAVSKVDEVSKQKEKVETVLTEKEKVLTKVSEKYEVAKSMLEDLRIREKNIKKMYEISIAEKNGMVSAEDYVKLNEYSESLEDKLNSLKDEIRKIKKENMILKRKLESDDEDEDDEEDKVDEKKKKEKQEYLRLKRKFEADKKDDKEDDDEEIDDDDTNAERMAKVRAAKKDSYNFRNDNEVMEYYLDIKKHNPNVVKIKETILECKTVKEASHRYMTLKDLIADKQVRKYEDLQRHEKTDDLTPISNAEVGIHNILRKDWK